MLQTQASVFFWCNVFTHNAVTVDVREYVKIIVFFFFLQEKTVHLETENHAMMLEIKLQTESTNKESQELRLDNAALTSQLESERQYFNETLSQVSTKL